MTRRRPSTVPDAEDALLALLQAAVTGALVQYGLPTDVPAERDRLYLVGVENLTRELAAQQGARFERYTLPLIVECQTFGDTRRDARNRAFEILEAVEDAITASPELDGTVDEATVAAVPALTVRPTQDGWIAQGSLNVHVEATI